MDASCHPCLEINKNTIQYNTVYSHVGTFSKPSFIRNCTTHHKRYNAIGKISITQIHLKDFIGRSDFVALDEADNKLEQDIHLSMHS